MVTRLEGCRGWKYIYNYLKWITEAEGVTALLHFYVVILIETCTITFSFYPNKPAKV